MEGKPAAAPTLCPRAGYCLPSAWSDATFDWLYWPQSKVPFTARTRAYIADLDADRDLALLLINGLRLRPECERIFKVCLASSTAAAPAVGPACA